MSLPKISNSEGRVFKSDNYSGIHPKILQAIVDANAGHAGSYGADFYTQQCSELFNKVFKKECKVAFTLNGTGTNVLALKTVLKSYNSVICATTAHINANETGAPESLVGCKLLLIDSEDGKITAGQIKNRFEAETLNGRHATLPKLVSISQPTEYGTVYSPEELSEISAVCKKLGLYLHIDACRSYNAASFLNCELSRVVAGADLISLGGTKLGAMLAEALVIFHPDLWTDLEYLHKNSIQLFSKNRFIAAQYLALFENDLYKKIAGWENALAKNLADQLEKLNLKITQKVQTNHVFVEVSESLAKKLEVNNFCYIWSQNPYSVRFVVSFDNTESDVENLIKFIKDNL